MFHDTLIGTRAPEFPDGLTWLNSEPLRIQDMRDKVVLIDFWTYSCVNCIRTLPYLKKWHERYKDLGLVIIGVHTPEFAFENRTEHVQRALKDFDISYPVVLDSDYHIWNAYTNHAWPHKFLINTEGTIVYDHAGEGDYGRTEREIQTLLRKVRLENTEHSERADASFPAVEADAGTGGVCYPTTPELYTGYMRGRVGNPRTYFRKEEAYLFHDQESYQLHQWYLEGEWRIGREFAEHARQTNALADYLALCFSASEVNVVMEASRPARIELLWDGAKPFKNVQKHSLARSLFGKDVYEEGGHAFVDVSSPRMYNIISANELLEGVVYLATKDKGVRTYAFTFGGCIQ